MASYTKGGGDFAPFGKNNFLRSTQPGSYLTDSYTASSAAWPVETVDGFPQKIAQPGEALVVLTSGPEAGKVVPLQALGSGGTSVGQDLVTGLVGVNKTHCPVQLNDRDVELSVVYMGSLKQIWCFERDATGARIVMSNTTADALRGKKGLQILFK